MGDYVTKRFVRTYLDYNWEKRVEEETGNISYVRIPGEKSVTKTIEITVDFEELANTIGMKALKSKGGKSVLGEGKIVAKVVK